MSFTIPTIYTAIDRFSGKVQGMQKANQDFADKVGVSGSRMQRAFNSMGESASSVALKAGAMGLAILAPLGLAAKKAIDFEDRMADVAKTTGLSGQELDSLGKAIRAMGGSTRTGLNDLATIAEVAGRLGVAKNELLGFVKASDKFAIALGTDYSGGVETAIMSVSKLANLFEETRKIPIADSITKIGSAINEMGAKGLGTSENINDFMLRLGALPEKLKPSISDAAALGGFLEKSGMSAEIASGGLSNFFIVANQSLGKFAAQMHLSKAAAQQMFSQDPTEFAKKFAASMKGLNSEQLATKLKDLGIGSQETIKVLGALSANLEGLGAAQKIAADGFSAGTSLADEAAKKNDTMAAKFAKAKNMVADLAITVGEALMPAISSLMETISPVIQSVVEWTKEHSALMSFIVPAVGVFGTLLLALSGFATVIGVITKASAAWNIVQQILNGTMKANPIGVIITIIALLAAGIAWVVKNTEGWGEQWDATVSWIKSVGKAMALDFQLKFHQIGFVFEKMVNTIVKAWYWAENKMGMISDDDYKKKIANINAEEKAQLDSIAKIQAAYDAEMNKVKAGPGMHIRMKTDELPTVTERGGVALPKAPSTRDFQQQDWMQSIAKQAQSKDKLEVVVKAAPGTDASVGRNTLGIPVKLAPSTLGWLNKGK
jgi:TP901 family phage tail tape measure protein